MVRRATHWFKTTLFVLAANLCAAPLVAQSAPDRFAFVVGNSAYERRADGQMIESSTLNLYSPRHDASKYVDVLEGMGWEVLNEVPFDRTAASLENDLDAAARRITSGSEVVFVFNGHGFSQGTSNYLVGVPDDAERYASVGDMRAGSIELSDVVARLAEANPARIILIINACGDEALVDGANLAPTKPRFDTSVEEVLVLYSSSPKGVAFDFVDSPDLEGENDGFDLGGEVAVHSVFSRAFLSFMEKDEPLLTVFAETRIEVEKISRRAADFRNMPGRQGLQIPHVLFDTINGQFNLADVSGTLSSTSLGTDWRHDPQVCRFSPDSLQEAHALRAQTGIENNPQARACILAAALADMGIEKLGFDSSLGGVIVVQTTPDALFGRGDLITRLTVSNSEGREKLRFKQLSDFAGVLAQYFNEPGHKLVFSWKNEEAEGKKSGFKGIEF
ncbi:MAG: caspase family protein [Shimia sp.]|uniref:caspase family protein n=1 Tax=Shimia sp. TaxID=1954381 RepID=UPI004058C1DC